jgi:hypothetical protein
MGAEDTKPRTPSTGFDKIVISLSCAKIIQSHHEVVSVMKMAAKDAAKYD